jgi:hypothetical protein
VKYLKVVTEMKIFGFTICTTYQQTMKKTWDRVLRGFESFILMAVKTAGHPGTEGGGG